MGRTLRCKETQKEAGKGKVTRTPHSLVKNIVEAKAAARKTMREEPVILCRNKR